jgi:hypothetical protein
MAAKMRSRFREAFLRWQASSAGGLAAASARHATRPVRKKADLDVLASRN